MYYSGHATRTGVRLYSLEHGQKVVEEFSPAYYFCIAVGDAIEHRQQLKEWKARKILQRTQRDHDHVRLYCETANLRRNDEGEFEEIDQRVTMLEYFEEHDVPTFEADLNALQRYMVDHDIQIADTYRVGFFDIETDDRLKEAAIDDEDEARERDDEVYEMIEIGRDRIISCAVVDANHEHYFTGQDEAEMLRSFLECMERYTLVVSWYGRGFDWPYLRARCKVHDIPWTLGDLNHVDFHKWFTDAITANSIKDRPNSLKLADVCEQYIGEVKTEGVEAGHGNLWQLFEDEPERLKEYNLQDCKLLRRLDEELNITRQVIMAAQICGVFPGRSSNTMLTDSFLLRLARKTNRRLNTRKWHRKPWCKPPGGRVYIKEAGTREGVLGFDFAGYYNTVMRYWNIGPDTMRIGYQEGCVPSALVFLGNQFMRELARECGGKLKMGHVYSMKCRNGRRLESALDRVYARVAKSYTMSEKAFLRYFFRFKATPHGIEVTQPFPIFFDHTRKSIVVEALEEYTTNRNEWKAQPQGLVRDIMVNVFKLLGNAMYGQFGAIHSRFYHEAMPGCVTLAAQLSTKLTRDWFEDHGCEVVYMDTDSNYVVPPVNEAALLKLWERDFHPYLHDALSARFGIEGDCPIELEYEKRWSRVLFITKKRYAGRIVWKDGKRCNKVEIKGLGPARRDSIDFRKRFECIVIDKILRRRGGVPTVRYFERLFRQALDDFDSATLQDVAKRVTIRRSPQAYEGNQTHIRIMKSMARRGDFAGVGQMFAYVRIATESKMKEGEELSYILRNNMTIDWDGIWRDWVWKPIRQLLEAARPEGDWLQFSPESKRKSEWWFKVLSKRIERNEKSCDRKAAIEKAIGSYENFTMKQRMELKRRLADRRAARDVQ